MAYNVKLTQEALEQIKELTGIRKGVLNFQTGVLRLSPKSDVEEVSKLYGIDNINNKPYVDFNPQPEMSLEERRLIIGNKVQIGSIVRVRSEGIVYHIVITSVEGNWYEGAKIILSATGYDAENEVLLTKGKDVIYRNLTYKEKVRVLSDSIYGLKEENIIRGAAGKIVGKVVDEEVMQQIINLVSTKKKAKSIHFETAVKEAESYDELLESLRISDNILSQAIAICVYTKRFGMKRLIPMLQQEHLSEGLTQNAIKNLLTQEFTFWYERENVKMDEYTVSYFLKVIVKMFKNA